MPKYMLIRGPDALEFEKAVNAAIADPEIQTQLLGGPIVLPGSNLIAQAAVQVPRPAPAGPKIQLGPGVAKKLREQGVDPDEAVGALLGKVQGQGVGTVGEAPTEKPAPVKEPPKVTSDPTPTQTDPVDQPEAMPEPVEEALPVPPEALVEEEPPTDANDDDLPAGEPVEAPAVDEPPEEPEDEERELEIASEGQNDTAAPEGESANVEPTAEAGSEG